MSSLSELTFEESGDEDFEGEWKSPTTWEDVKDFKLVFGKFKGKTLQDMLITSRGRNYLKYLLRWDELRPYTKEHITLALSLYKKQMKRRNKKRRRGEEVKRADYDI